MELRAGTNDITQILLDVGFDIAARVKSTSKTHSLISSQQEQFTIISACSTSFCFIKSILIPAIHKTFIRCTFTLIQGHFCLKFFTTQISRIRNSPILLKRVHQELVETGIESSHPQVLNFLSHVFSVVYLFGI